MFHANFVQIETRLKDFSNLSTTGARMVMAHVLTRIRVCLLYDSTNYVSHNHYR